MSHLSVANAERLEQLTGLRFFAALGVLFCHYFVLFPLNGVRFLADLGGHGVTLFFVLSGFVLTWRYEAGQGAAVPGVWSVRQMKMFAVARLARIVPNYWLALALTLVVYAWLPSVVALGPVPQGAWAYALALGANVLALQAWVPDESVQQYWNAPGWSVSAEFFFYACFPLLLRVRQLSGSWRSLVGVVCFFALLLWGYLVVIGWLGWWSDLSMSFAARLPLLNIYSFVIGIALGRLVSKTDEASVGGVVCNPVYALMALVVVAWAEGQGQAWLGEQSLLLALVVMYFAYVPLFAWLVVAVALNKGRVACFLTQPWVLLLGNASYALYLLHWLPLSVWYHHGGQHGVGLLPLCGVVLGLVVASVLVYQWFETPLRKWVVDLAARRWA